MLKSSVVCSGDQPQWDQHERTRRTHPGEQARCLDQRLEGLVSIPTAPHKKYLSLQLKTSVHRVSPEQPSQWRAGP